MSARKTGAPAVRDVARRAGVSTSAISHVLNGTRFVSDELRERVHAAMHELEYAPNAAARMLTLRRSNTIGLIVSDTGRTPLDTTAVATARPGRRG
jgi:LacI family transcriptional regulator